MTFSKRSFLHLVAVQTVSLALAACGGDDDSSSSSGTAGGTAAGSLAITGTSNFPSPATPITPNAGLGANSSLATVAGNLLNVSINSLVNNVSRTLSVPLAGSAPPALNSTYRVVADGNNANGSVLTLVAVDVLASKNYFFSSESGTVKITALSATSVELLFTDVTLAATAGAQNQSATGKVILNGTVTVART